MLDRLNQPIIPNPENIYIPELNIKYSNNNIPICLINEGTQEVIKIEFIFSAGLMNSKIPLLASATNELVDEGSTYHSSAEIAEMLDKYGAYLQTEVSNDWATITLYSLNKFLPKTLPVFKEILMNPAFSENEINTFSVQGKQRMAVNLEKVDYLARRNFLKTLYGEKHPLGIMPELNDFDNLSKELLTEFYNSHYKNGLKTVIVAGKFDSESEKNVIDLIENLNFKKSNLDSIENFIIPKSNNVYIEKKDAVQSAIRVGKRLFNRHHPDYFAFTILNTILGGYFGSRLMSNIREDKGYTYGIGSGIMPNLNDGYFYIATEVGSDVVNETVKEIFFELDRVKDEKIEDAELNLVKNYLFGSFQRSIDGVFLLADKNKSLVVNNLDSSYLHKYLDVLKNINPDHLQVIAKKYLTQDSLSKVIVG